MSVGLGLVTYNEPPLGNGAKAFFGAYNGLSVDSTGKVVLGNDFTAATEDAKFISFREIDMNGFNIFMDIWGNFSGSTPNPEYFSAGQNPFVGINGATIGINYEDWHPAVNGFMGFYMNEYVIGSVATYMRGMNNDSWVWGSFYNVFGSAVAPNARFNLFDNGNLTFNHQDGTYPQSQDIDTGTGFMIFSPNGFAISPDITFSESLEYQNSILQLNRIESDFSSGSITYLLSNSATEFKMIGTTGSAFSPGLPVTDIGVIEFDILPIIDTFLVFADDGSIILGGVADKPLILNSGNQYQVYGNIETKPSASGSSGSIFNGSMQTNQPGSISGNAIFSQPNQGGSTKEVMIQLINLNGTATFNFPTNFVNVPIILTTNSLPAATVTAISINSVTVTGAGTSGFIILRGF